MMSYEARSFYQDDGVAQGYDEQFRSPLRRANLRAKLVGRGEMAAFSRMLAEVPPGGRVLDIACGSGRYLEVLLRRGYQVAGLDISGSMLRIAHSRVGDHPNLLALHRADAVRLPFAAGQFDGVTCMRLFHRVPPAIRLNMLREVQRVGRTWGVLFFGLDTPWLMLRRRIRRMLMGYTSNPYPASRQQLAAELTEAGFGLCDTARVLPILSEGLVTRVSW